MHWRKLHVLGAGSYGTVSLASCTDRCSTFAAVKSAVVGSPSSTLETEGQILDAMKDSPYVLRCFGEDVSVENGSYTYNLLLEYASGGTLHDLIQKSKKMMQESQVSYYAFQLLTGISHVHHKGFIHCDLKPSNILVFPTTPHEDDDNGMNVLKLADFGLSLRADVGTNETNTYWNRSASKSPRHQGTLLYAPPEAVRRGIHGKAVDIWALGCIIVEMITGKALWSGCTTIEELVSKIIKEEPKNPNNVSEVCRDFLSKCLERNHKLRWTAEKLLNHPFIQIGKLKEDYGMINHNNKGITNPFSRFGRSSWVSKKNLFSTSFVPSSCYGDNFREVQIFPGNNAQCGIGLVQ